MELWLSFSEWFIGLGKDYGVNPVIFGSLYVGSIPFFAISLGWVIKNIRQSKPVLFPVLLTGIFFISAYLYLILVGKNIPVWVYLFIVIMVIFGFVSMLDKIRKSTRS